MKALTEKEISTISGAGWDNWDFGLSGSGTGFDNYNVTLGTNYTQDLWGGTFSATTNAINFNSSTSTLINFQPNASISYTWRF